VTALWEDAAPMPSFTPAYRAVILGSHPIVRLWGRMRVTGLERLPATGPVLLAANHDSYWDPVAIGLAAYPVRQVHALAKASMWTYPVVGQVLTGMGQIPIRRGARDEAAMDRAVQELRAGACIGVFPEATRSLGRELRARSGLGRLAQAVPEAEIVACAVTGTVDIPRFPTRPDIRVDFFRPAAVAEPGAPPAELPSRLLEEIRARAPIVAAGRRPRSS
jgi:1-acyl-sn-glycerol-3-phosphate acyltransferase